MKNFRFTFLIILLFATITFSLSAQDFFICLGSYKNKDNAQDLVYSLRKDFYPASIHQVQTEKGTLYRVFIEIPYKTRENAYQACETLKSIESFSKYNIKDPWIFQADIKADKHNTLPTKIKEQKNKTENKLPAKKVETAKPTITNITEPSALENETTAEKETSPVEASPVEEPTKEPSVEEPSAEAKTEEIQQENATSKAEEIPPTPVQPMELFVEIEIEDDDEQDSENAVRKNAENRVLPAIISKTTTRNSYLTMNDKLYFPLSLERPYSVFIRSYKVEKNAKRDMARLLDLGIKSYLVKTFDQEKFFSFEIHIGSFETLEEATSLQKRLTQSGIDYTDVSDYRNLKERMENYDSLMEVEKVCYEDIDGELSSLYSDKVLYCVKNFPTQQDFIVDQAGIFDFENVEDSFERTKNLRSLFSTMNVVDFSSSTIDSCAFTVYVDELFSKNVSVSFFHGNDFDFKEIAKSKIQEFYSQGNLFSCVTDNDENSTYLFCISQDKKSFIFIESTDYGAEELFNLFNNQKNDNGLLCYDEIKNTILVLPQSDDSYEQFVTNFDNKNSEKISNENIKFSSFTLENISFEYSKERNYSEWSVPLVGQWFAEGRFILKNEMVSFGYFFLNYDYSAKLSHNLFMKAKIQDKENDKVSHFSSMNDGNSWYLDNEFMKELSFTQKAYVIAIDCYSDSAFTEDDMINIAKKLNIW